jgi:hypothetical protein
MTQEPMHVFELDQVRIGERAAQPFQFAFPQSLESLAIELGDMKAVRTNEHALTEHRLGGTDESLIEIRTDDLDGAT